MKKRWLPLLLVLLICFSVSSCVHPENTDGSSAESTTQTQGQTDPEKSEEPTDPASPAQPDLPPDDGWSKIY